MTAFVRDASAVTTFEVKPTWLNSQVATLTATVVGLAGAIEAVAVGWRKGFFRGKID